MHRAPRISRIRDIRDSSGQLDEFHFEMWKFNYLWRACIYENENKKKLPEEGEEDDIENKRIIYICVFFPRTQNVFLFFFAVHVIAGVVNYILRFIPQ